MKYPDQLPQLNSRGKHLGLWVLLITILLSVWIRHADASWTQTGDTFTEDKYIGVTSVTEMECNSGTYSLPFDCASNPDVSNTRCSILGYMNASGLGPAFQNNPPVNIDTVLFLWGDQYLDFACTGTTLTQFDVYDPATPPWGTGSSSTGTTSPIQAPYLPVLSAFLFFCAFWTTIFLMLWKRN